MQRTRLEFQTINQIRTFVSHTLCQQNDIEVGVFHQTENILTRSGSPCGILFCLHGPRSVKLTAIWETDKNTILFYGSAGEKLQRAELTQAPELAVVNSAT